MSRPPEAELIDAVPELGVRERIRGAVADAMERDRRALRLLRFVGRLIISSTLLGLVVFGVGLAIGAGSPPAWMMGAALTGAAGAWIGLIVMRLRLASRLFDGSMVPRASRPGSRYRLRGSFWNAVDQRIDEMDYGLLAGVVHALQRLGGQARLDAVARAANEDLEQVFGAAITLHRAALLTPVTDVRGEVALTPLGRDVAGPARA